MRHAIELVRAIAGTSLEVLAATETEGISQQMVIATLQEIAILQG